MSFDSPLDVLSDDVFKKILPQKFDFSGTIEKFVSPKSGSRSGSLLDRKNRILEVEFFATCHSIALDKVYNVHISKKF